MIRKITDYFAKRKPFKEIMPFTSKVRLLTLLMNFYVKIFNFFLSQRAFPKKITQIMKIKFYLR